MRLVLVEWVDSERRDDWERLDEDLKPSHLRCRSVGWLMSDTALYKTVVPHIDEDGVQGCGGMTIPTCAVIRIHDLATPDTATC